MPRWTERSSEKERDKAKFARLAAATVETGVGAERMTDLIGSDLGSEPGRVDEDRPGVPTTDEPQKAKDFTSDQEVRWCPGCGDYVILNTIRNFLPGVGPAPREHRVRQRDRLLQPLPVLHGDLRVPLDSRPRADHRHRPQPWPARTCPSGW